jgi:hypothetical protein
MGPILEGLRRRTKQPIQPIFSDLASNNFNQLFTNLEEARRAGLFPADIYPSAVGGSFYGPLLPPGTVHLATCFNAINWLDRLPSVPVPDYVAYRRPLPSRPGRTVPLETTAAFTRQAEQDLVRFLESRARELVPGGKLLLASPGDTNQARVGDGLADVLNDACLDLVATGQLKQEEYERLTMPCYFRTVRELLAPVQREGSPVRGAFTVDRAHTLEVPPPFVVDFRRSGDATAYAGAYTGFIRAFSEPVVRAALRNGGENGAGPPRIRGLAPLSPSSLQQPVGEAATVASLYERIRGRLVAEPERYLFRYILVAVLLTRC